MKKHFTLLFIILICCIQAFSQENYTYPGVIKEVDSIVKKRNLNDLEKLEEIEKFLILKKSELDLAQYFKLKGNLYQYNENYIKATFAYKESLKILDSISSSQDDYLHRKAILYTNLASSFKNIGFFDSTFLYAYKGIDAGKILKDDKRIGTGYFSIGTMYYKLTNNDLALRNFKLAETYFTKCDNNRLLTYTYNNLGLVYTDVEMYDSAIICFNNALFNAYKTEDYYQACTAYNNMSLAYSNNFKFKESELYLDSALSLAKEIDYEQSIMQSEFLMATQYTLQKKYSKSISKINTIINYFKNDHYKLSSIYNILGINHIGLGDLKKGRYYFTRENRLNDSIKELNNAIKIRELEEKVKKDLKAIELDKRASALALEKVELEKSKQTHKFIFFIGIIALFIFAYALWEVRKNKKTRRALKLQSELLLKSKKDLEKLAMSKQEKEMLIKEIHHRVKNNLQVIISLLRFQSTQANKSNIKELFLECQNRVQSMALIHEQLYKTKDLSNVLVSDYLKDLIGDLIEAYSIDIPVNLDSDIKVNHLNLDTLIPLGLVVNEIVSNSLKHAYSKKLNSLNITISIKNHHKNRYILFFSDNGSGLPQNFDWENSDSLGFELIRTFTEQLEGSIHVKNKNGLQYLIYFNDLVD